VFSNGVSIEKVGKMLSHKICGIHNITPKSLIRRRSIIRWFWRRSWRG